MIEEFASMLILSDYLACIVCRAEKSKILSVILAQITPSVVLLLHAELWEVGWGSELEIARVVKVQC